MYIIYMGSVTGDGRVVTALSLTSLSLKGLNDMKQQSEFNEESLILTKISARVTVQNFNLCFLIQFYIRVSQILRKILFNSIISHISLLHLKIYQNA